MPKFIQVQFPSYLLTVRWEGSGLYGVWVIRDDIEYIKLSHPNETQSAQIYLESIEQATVETALKLKGMRDENTNNQNKTKIY